MKIALKDSTRLFLLSFLLLFGEVMFIRWLSCELPIIRIMPNVVLMIVCVASAAGLANPTRYKFNALVSLVALGALIFVLALAQPLHLDDLALHIITGDPTLGSTLGIIALVVICLTTLFLRLGSALGDAFNTLPPLKAYSVNLLGSIAGVIIFGMCGWLQLSPPYWIFICGAITFLLAPRPWIAALTVVLVGALVYANIGARWSPYNKIRLIPVTIPKEAGMGDGNYMLMANNRWQQFGFKILPQDQDQRIKDTISKYPDMATVLQRYQWMSIPFLYAPKHDNVLILGAGTGNDVAIALRSGAKHVDAVEIDPVTAEYGRTKNPNHPYADPRVTIHNEDARTFLRNTHEKYDVILFAYLDIATSYNSPSYLRLDNFINTVEGFRGAAQHVSGNGIVALSFATGPDDIITHRLYASIKQATGKAPQALTDPHDVFFLFGPGLGDQRITDKSGLGLQVWPPQGATIDEKPATDDWPFLYLTSSLVGFGLYMSVLGISVLVPALLLTLSTGKAISGPEWGTMFFLGQAFMLVETKSILQLSLLFGATWIVNSVVILTILLLAYFANLLVTKYEIKKTWLLYLGIAVSLLLDYLWRVPDATTMPPLAIDAISTVLACLPVFFGGMVFSTAFKRAENSSQYLSANLLGFAVGGISENLSLWSGSRSLCLVALGLYGLSYICFLLPKNYSLMGTKTKPSPSESAN